MLISHLCRRHIGCVLILAIAICWLHPRDIRAQGSVQVGSQRPFVTALIPVVGPGAVGGVSVDAKGVVSRSTTDATDELRKARLKALQKVDSSVGRKSALRKVSLRRLEDALIALKKKGRPIPDEMRYLAGLQRIRYVFVYPEEKDIVLAGIAEGWMVDDSGTVVGKTSGRPVMQLDDLVVAMRSARTAKTTMSCSIDPTKAGVARLQRLLRTRGFRINKSTVARLEQTLGPQIITFTEVPTKSHFARVMLAADIRMKLLGMNFELSPVTGLPSYLQLLQQSTRQPPRTMMPRWWLAPAYEPVRKAPDGLAWELRGNRVRATTGERAHPLASRWAELMSDKYPELCEKIPVFAELQNCMDLAVVAALIEQEQLGRRANTSFSLLLDAKQLQTAEYPVPKSLTSRAGVIRKGRDWIVSVSGGVEINPWSLIEKPETSKALADQRKSASGRDELNWWWD